ncbi:hypothetical protein [Paractinoplanes rishiriensis]|uniref:Uncharacterized protein n=1 Tax=Paractinoplanes rishiriensis TaxID=1050105 RepID=A0A919N2N4_9ACTN|nr:hypothetical protein [Actinoplanes rishiriensis]GIF01048.1 hypothetical protein Ari01nite_85120 [Actinoplanes rishiriensis]
MTVVGTGRSVLIGAALGAWLGMLTGLLLGVLLPGAPWLLTAAGGLAIGAAAGGILGLITYGATRAPDQEPGYSAERPGTSARSEA